METFEKVLGYYRGVFSFTPLSQSILTTKESVSFPNIDSVLPTKIVKELPENVEKVSYEGKDYFVKKEFLSLEEVKNLKTGEKVWCNLLRKRDGVDRAGQNYGSFCLGTIYLGHNSNSVSRSYIITDHFCGSTPKPSIIDWKRFGEYSWAITNIIDMGEGVRLIVENPLVEKTYVETLVETQEEILTYVERHAFGETLSGILSNKPGNASIFANLGVNYHKMVVNDRSDLVKVNPNIGRKVKVLRKFTSPLTKNTYCLVEFDGKFCVINKENLK